MIAGYRGSQPRRGTIIPVLALSITGIFAFVALAIDMGMLTVARTECQNAADSAALAGCRNLDNKPSALTTYYNNSEVAVTAARDTLFSNSLVGNAQNAASSSGGPAPSAGGSGGGAAASPSGRSAFLPEQVETLRVGVYDYVDTVGAERFLITSYSPNAIDGEGAIVAPGAPPSDKGWTAVEVVVAADIPSYFSRVLGVSGLQTGARALAVHRPRDVAIVLDFSGSMKFGTSFTWPNTSATATANGSMNPDPVYPQFAHYQRYRAYSDVNPLSSNVNATNPSSRPNPLFMRQAYIRTDSGETTSPANFTVETMGGPAIVRDFRRSTLASGSAVPSDADLVNAFHHWNPPEVSPLVIDRSDTSAPPIVNAATFRYSNYPAVYDRQTVVTPAPENFAEQTDVDSFGVSVPYLGDKFPRKLGAATGSAPSTGDPDKFWSPTDPNGPAVTLAEYLGWYRTTTDTNALYSGGSSLPTLPYDRTTTSGRGDLGLNTTYCVTADYATDHSNFRDATWERYGYDLDVANYVGTRDNQTGLYTGSGTKKWDPRWDWNGTAFVHTRPATGNGSKYPTDSGFVQLTAANVNEIIKLKPAAQQFQGFSMGPGYWGKTFFIWPPDPRFDTSANLYSVNATRPAVDVNGKVMGDWRRRFFYRAAAGDFNPQADNIPGSSSTYDGINERLLRSGVGSTLIDSGTSLSSAPWKINYRAVLAWIKSGPQTLPANLRAGRVLYYTAIPDDIPTSGSLTDDQRFWREYIDYVLGYRANGRSYDPNDSAAGVEGKGWPESVSGSSVSTVTPSIFTGSMNHYTGSGSNDPMPYMRYTDNPSRPRSHFWFGPLSMVDFISAKNAGDGDMRNFNAGTIHEAQCWQLKVGIQSALDDIRNNHPNDWVGMTYFAGGGNDFGRRVLMGQQWTRLKNTLFYPYDKINATTGVVAGEWRVFNSSFNIVSRTNLPNADGGTDPGTGLANAYNLLSNATGLSPDGTGRRGAAKLVVLETDGVPNTHTTASNSGKFTANGSQSYYNSTSPSGYAGNGDSGVINSALGIVDQIVAPVSDSGASGYSLPNTPARVYAIAYGDLFDSGGYQEDNARAFLRDVAVRGKTLNSGAAGLPDNHIITGNYQDRIDRLRDCMERIMQSGVQVTLIE